MARFAINSSIVDTEKARHKWDEKRESDGSNMIGRATGAQWEDETLYLSASGKMFYVVRASAIQGAPDLAREVSKDDAVRWLLLNEHDIPEFLAAEAAAISD